MIDRQGLLIANPTADERLFSGDKLLLLGGAEQLAQGAKIPVIIDRGPLAQR